MMMTAERLASIPWWIPPKMWKGDSVYILGGGPSLLSCDLRSIQGERVIAVNDGYLEPVAAEYPNTNYRIRQWAAICIFGDWGWWDLHWKDWILDEIKGRNHPGLQRFPGLIVSNNPPKNMWKIVEDAQGRVLPMKRVARGIPEDRGCLTWYDNTGAAAIHLALLLGASKITLLGFDMNRTEGKQNWHSAIKKSPPESRNQHHADLHERLAVVVKEHPEYGKIPVINASPGTSLEAWEKEEWKKRI